MVALMFPGQGSQSKGMGQPLFARFPELTQEASDILGESIPELCLHDPDGHLDDTRYTQVALFVVEALAFLARREDNKPEPTHLLGHSLGEYGALFAGDAFDFETGVTLVIRRGALMADMKDGAMAAVVGLDADRIAEALAKGGLHGVDLANYNAPSQIVISGVREEV